LVLKAHLGGECGDGEKGREEAKQKGFSRREEIVPVDPEKAVDGLLIEITTKEERKEKEEGE